jgi:hypothetical protein
MSSIAKLSPEVIPDDQFSHSIYSSSTIVHELDWVSLAKRLPVRVDPSSLEIISLPMIVLVQQAECMLQAQICEEEIRACVLSQPACISPSACMDAPWPSGRLSLPESQTKLRHVSSRAR